MRRAIRIILFTVMYLAAFLVGAAFSDDATKSVPSDLGIKIRDAQLEQTRAQAQQQVLVQQYQQVQQTLQDDVKKLQALKDQALKDAGLDPKVWAVDMEKLVFTPIPTGAPQPPQVVTPASQK